MTWLASHPRGVEVGKVRARVHRFCIGRGLDVGAEAETVTKNAMGIGGGAACFIQEQITAPDALKLFSTDSVDFVFSCFTLNQSKTIDHMLSEWWRVLRPGGHLILYQPHKALYPAAAAGISPRHVNDLTPEDVLNCLSMQGCVFEEVVCELRDGGDEYAFELVLKKHASPIPLEVKQAPGKRAAVCRYGGFGDTIMGLAVVRELKRLGYHVTYYTSDRGAQVAAYDPAVDKLIVHTEDMIEPKNLMGYWESLAKHYDRMVNLNGTMEGVLLFRGPGAPKGGDPVKPMDEAYGLNYEERHKRGNSNYMEHMLGFAGMPNLDPAPPAIHFTPIEKAMAGTFRAQFGKDFLVVVNLGGSADHKLWYHSRAFVEKLLARIPDARVVLMGDTQFQMLEWDNPRVTCKAGRMPFRSSALICTVADLVVSTETGLAHAAAGAGTPLLALMSHSSPENLTKHWASAVPIVPPVACTPCHQLHYGIQDCPTDAMPFRFANGETRNVPVCTSRLTSGIVLEEAVKVYERWKAAQPLNGHLVPA